jgi:FAD/FMN-containing dehydrogenase
VILGYGQFGVITEATLKVRPYTPLSHALHTITPRCVTAIEDLQMLDRDDASRLLGHPHHHGLRR